MTDLNRGRKEQQNMNEEDEVINGGHAGVMYHIGIAGAWWETWAATP